MSKPEAIRPEKMELTSMNVPKEKREELKRRLGQVFPEVFAEGSIDFDQLKRVLGEWVDPGKERFGLNWPGKARMHEDHTASERGDPQARARRIRQFRRNGKSIH